jgi:hypothetical protein
MPTLYLAALVVLGGLGDATPPVFAPANPRAGFTTPGEEFAPRWRLVSGEAADPLAYRVLDYTGKTLAEGRLRRVDGQQWETTLRPAQGFVEIELPASGQRFGVVCLQPGLEEPDRFFAIDGALSWLVTDASSRDRLIEAAHRMGIAMVRERLSWGAVHPEPRRWEWQGTRGYDTIREVYRKSQVPILEMAHDSPRWLGLVGKYPRDLVGASHSWTEVARRWQSTWGGVEIWNEPDIFFGGDLPADQYVAFAKAVSFALSKAACPVPVVGGVMALPNRDFLETCGQSGLLDRVDAFSFHTYETAMNVEGLVTGYRQWLRKYGHAGMPLWLTESGRPWRKGPDRPPIDQDQASALDITMKGVESNACGVDRYFAFVYPFFEENTQNFGMMDRRGTPLRSMAAYAQMIRILSRKQYEGDLRSDVPALKRARVFGDGEQNVVVLYTGRPGASESVSLGLGAVYIEGIDGRRLMPGSDGSIPVPDGLSYVWFDGEVNVARLIADTAASRLRPTAGASQAVRGAPSQIVLRFQLDAAHHQASSRGYRVKQAPAGTVRLGFDVWNLADQPHAIDLELKLAPAKASSVQPGRSLKLAARSSSSVDWPLDLGPMFASNGRVTAQVVARDEDGVRDQLAVVLTGETDLAQTLAGSAHPIALPISERSRWTPNISPAGTMTMDASPEAAWRLQVKQEQGGDRWAYPFFRLPEGLRLEQGGGLILRARCARPASVRVFLWEGSADVGYITPDPVIPADGQWHVARIAFRDLVPSTANAPDPNGTLDLEKVYRFSVGMNSTAPENTLEISDLHVVGTTGGSGDR